MSRTRKAGKSKATKKEKSKMMVGYTRAIVVGLSEASAVYSASIQAVIDNTPPSSECDIELLALFTKLVENTDSMSNTVNQLV